MFRDLVLFLAALAAIGLLAAGCSMALPDLVAEPAAPAMPAATVTPAVEEESTVLPTSDVDTGDVDTGAPTSGRVIIRDGGPPPFDPFDWRTDFSIRSVEWSEILSGGPPKDGIPAIDDPQFESIAAAAEWLTDRDPVIFFAHNGVERAYPLSILIWHEIVNDVVGDKPVAVTFCPLCNASIVFDRVFEGEILDFGTTGRLRNSDLIMYDRLTETWWQQFTGEAIIGEWTGGQLRFLPSQVISFADFVAEHPNGEVLARPSGRSARSYGRNPYVGYDSTAQPFLFTGEIDDRLPAVERVVGLTTPTTALAYPWTTVAAAQVVEDEFDGAPIVIFHKEGRASALDTSTIADGRDIGTVGVFDRRLDGRTLTFTAAGDGLFTDAETGSTWNILGEAVDGPRAGAMLTPVLHFDHFWFAWAAFFPETDVYAE
jgi:hypothetical protein